MAKRPVRSPFHDEATDDLADDIAALMTGTLPHAHDNIDGETVYRVPLNNLTGTFVTLCPAGYEQLVAQGVDFLILAVATGGNAYVRHQRFGSRHRWDLTARSLAGASQGQLVRYANGDRTDLRRSNLILHQTKGAAA